MGKPFQVSLVCMPFCYLESPSLALTQLRTVLQERDPEMDVRICYAQHDFAAAFGSGIHQFLADSGKSLLGEWLFSHILFSRTEEAGQGFLARYCPDRFSELMELRRSVEGFLDALIEKYQLDQADVVGFTSLYQQTVPSLALSRRLGSLERRPVIVMGGGNCEGEMGKALIRNFSCLDYVFSGSALISFPVLIDCLQRGDRNGCDRIDGVFSHANECPENWDLEARASVAPKDAVIRTELLHGSATRPRVRLHGAERPVNDVVALDYADFLESYATQVTDAGNLQPRLPMETSRGCWWGEKSHCTFCGSCGWNIAYRQMEASHALDYMKKVINDHKAGAKYFECVDQLMPKDFPEQVFPRLQLDGDCGLFYEVRSSLTFEEMQQLRRSGIFAIQPGIEAISSRLLKLMAKGVSAAHNVLHLRNCATLGITPMWALLAGFPNEDDSYYKEYRRLLPALFHLPPPMSISAIDFHRNSPYTWYADKFAVKLEAAGVYRFIYDLPDTEIEDLAYFFEDVREGASYRENIRMYLPDLEVVVGIWRNAWLGHRGATPQLHFEAGSDGLRIIDTRAGTRRTHVLSPLEHRLLGEFADVKSVAAVCRRDGAAEPPEVVQAALMELERRQLLFCEDGRAVSLVLDRAMEPPPFLELLRSGRVVLH